MIHTLLAILIVGPSNPTPISPPRWGYDGHRIVCQIAWMESSETTRAALTEMLTMDDGYDTFPESCLWADTIRRDPEYSRFSTAHYVNIAPGAEEVSTVSDCADTYCVIEGIIDMRAILENDGFGDDERLDAMKFLSHFVGDVHQPLHAGYGDDRGGNSARVTVFGKEVNLHATWDYRLIEHTGLDWAAYADTLGKSITQDDREAWSTTNPAVWAWESFQIVEQDVYDYPKNGQIGEAYYRTNIPTVERQLQKAGFRLALVLNTLFANGETK